MNDPALGPTRAERAFGPRNRNQEFRNINNGMFSDPKPSYGRYSVSQNASDVLNKSKRRDTR